MNRIPAEILNAFYEKKEGNGLSFFINDLVSVVTGEKKGMAGAIVGLDSFQPFEQYLVEYPDGSSASHRVSDLQHSS